jgi:recombinational DNA repair protein RecT
MTTQSNGTATTKELPHAVGEKKPRSAALAVRDWMAQPTMSASLSAALGGYMTVEVFAAQCYIAAQDPKLATCSAESLFRGFLEVAQMGLLPGAHQKHVAMVPRNGIITVTPQWQGLVFLMTRQPGVARVKPYLVHVTDDFEADRDTVRVHKFDPFNPARIFEHPDTAKAGGREWGLRGGYVEITMDTGEVIHHFVPAAKIEKNRACAKTQDFWLKWPEEMILKTCLRDVFAKRVIPIDPQLASHIGAVEDADNRALGNDPSRSMVALPSSRTETLARSLGAAIVEDTPNMANVEVIDATTDPS